MTPDVRCPKCHEDRLVETIQTGRFTTFFCAVCGYAWRAQ